MIFDDNDFIGSKPARRADGKAWEVWQLEGGHPARSANVPAVTTGCHEVGTMEQTTQSAHRKSDDVVGRDGAQAPAREELSVSKTENLSPLVETSVSSDTSDLKSEPSPLVETTVRVESSGLKPRHLPSFEMRVGFGTGPLRLLADEETHPAISGFKPEMAISGEKGRVFIDTLGSTYLAEGKASTTPPKLTALLQRLPQGVTVRDALRARVAPNSAAAADLLEGFARAGHLDRREDRPAAGGKAVVTYCLVTIKSYHQ